MECPQCNLEVSSDSTFCSRCGYRVLGIPNPFSTRTETFNYFAVTLEAGRVLLDKYRIIGLLGRGGMGIVYKAEDIKLKRTVALKFLRPEFLIEPEAKKRFLLEAQAAASLDHPHICAVYEVNEIDGQTFIAMPFIEGKSLKDKIETETLNLKIALSIFAQIGDGLAEAHAKGIIHRDIKPANVMVTEKNQAKIMDFGLAKLMESSEITQTTKIMGTVAYMSPEQASGLAIDARTDIWSLGVVLYEFLAGRLPFQTKNNQAFIYAILNENPKPISSIRPDIPGPLEAVVDRCLQKDPGMRYATAGELTADLNRILGALEMGEAPRIAPTPGRKTGRGIGRRTLVRLGAGLAVVALLGLVALLLRQNSKTAASPTGAAFDPALSVGAPAMFQILDLRDDGRSAISNGGSARGVRTGATGALFAGAEFDRDRIKRAIGKFFVKQVEANSCQIEIVNPLEPVRVGDYAELSKEPNGTLIIQAAPEDAEIYMDGALKGRASVKLLVPAGKYLVTVKKKDFLDKAEEVNVRALEIIRKSYILTAQAPSAQSGNLFVDSEPRGAQIYLDDRKTAEGKTPLNLWALAPRRYRVRVALEQYEVISQDFEIRGGQNNQMPLVILAPIAVDIELQTAPSEADVFIDENPLPDGKTPFRKSYPPGPHLLKIRKSGFSDHEEKATLAAGAPWKRIIELKPTLVVPKYRFNIDSVPSDARIFLNTMDKGRTPIRLEWLDPQVQVRIEHDGFSPASESLALKAGEELNRTITLIKLGTGKVGVSSFRPARAEIDGRLQASSVSTVKIFEMTEGARTIRFLFDDNIVVAKSVMVRPNATMNVHCSEDDYKKEIAQKSAYEIGAYPTAVLALDDIAQGNISVLKVLAVGDGLHQIKYQFSSPSGATWTFEIEDRIAALQKKRIHMSFESSELGPQDAEALLNEAPSAKDGDLGLSLDGGTAEDVAPAKDLRIPGPPRNGRRFGLRWKQSGEKCQASVFVYRIKDRQLLKFTIQISL
jgi:predicted Ser/Thr protein kinase